MKRFRTIFVGAAVAIAALMMLPTAGMAASQPKGKGLHGLYNARYCEIFSVTSLSPTIAVDVYNTIGLNKCPTDQFAALDLNVAKEQLGSLGTQKNGPRHWVIDGITGATAGEPLEIAGMVFRLVGVLTPPSLNPASRSTAPPPGTTRRAAPFVSPSRPTAPATRCRPTRTRSTRP